MSAEFKKLACKNIAFEVSAYFPDMSVCQLLKRYGTLRVAHDPTTPVRTASTRRTLAESLQHDIDSFVPTGTPGASSRDAFEVSCESCTTTICSCKEGEVLKDYVVVWASSALTVTVTPRTTATTTPATWRQTGSHTARMAPPKTLALQCDSLHIINKDVEQRRRPGSYALQSIFQPRYPLLLECYPRHMIHLALVTYALWHSPEALLKANAAQEATTDINLLPCSAEDAVLVLGLGGNVIGRCLDHLLAPAVRLDTVEIEPAILRTCAEQHQVPPLLLSTRTAPTPDAARRPSNGARKRERRDETGSSAATAVRPHSRGGGGAYWYAADEANADLADLPTVPSVEASKGGKSASRPREPAFTTARTADSAIPAVSPRGSRYRFFLEDAYRFLREPALSSDGSSSSTDCGSPRSDYSMIFLDCYDPDRERMLFDEGLVSLCHKRLRPGGCLLVNAHILPKLANLEGAFLFHGFATVQILRVAGCDQCIVACVRVDREAGGNVSPAEVERGLEAKQQRFTRSNVRLTAQRLNRILHQRTEAHADVTPPGRRSRRGDASGEDSEPQSLPFQLDEEWLCKNSIVAHMQISDESTGTHGPKARIRQSDCRVWEHST